MTSIFKNKLGSFFVEPAPSLKEAFLLHQAQKNNARFSVLPVFNIITQIACFFIYLYIYPATFPEKPQLDRMSFTILSVVYIATNVVFFVLFNHLRKNPARPGYVLASARTLTVFLLFYVLYESIETVLEVEISGNIYRFLATFFMVAFLPIMRRRAKVSILLLFTLAVEGGFAYIFSHGYASNNRFQEIVLLFFFVCLAVSNIAYSSAVRTFSLQHDLVLLNEQLQKANAQLAHLAVIDPLTEISNRRAFDQYMAIAWRAAYQDKRYLTVVMVDIDDFKLYNDTYGHQKGDECLIQVAACIKSFFVREADMVARYGGEEFIVLTVQENPESARALMEEMRRGVENLKIENKNGKTGPFVTISVGYASAIPADRLRYEYLIKQADDALYTAKNQGKNRIVAAPPAPAPGEKSPAQEDGGEPATQA